MHRSGWQAKHGRWREEASEPHRQRDDAGKAETDGGADKDSARGA